MKVQQTSKQFLHLIGQRVEFVFEGKRVIGKLDFAGTNEVLHNDFQVNVGRRPFWPVEPNSLKACPSEQTMFKS